MIKFFVNEDLNICEAGMLRNLLLIPQLCGSEKILSAVLACGVLLHVIVTLVGEVKKLMLLI